MGNCCTGNSAAPTANREDSDFYCIHKDSGKLLDSGELLCSYVPRYLDFLDTLQHILTTTPYTFVGTLGNKKGDDIEVFRITACLANKVVNQALNIICKRGFLHDNVIVWLKLKVNVPSKVAKRLQKILKTDMDEISTIECEDVETAYVDGCGITSCRVRPSFGLDGLRQDSIVYKSDLLDSRALQSMLQHQ